MRPCWTTAFVAIRAAGCDVGQEIQRPTPVFDANPVEYPLESWKQYAEGTTHVRVLVNAEGGVERVEVSKSSGHPALDSAAVRGALAMTFEPAMRGNAPIRVWTRLVVHFRQGIDRPLASARDAVEWSL